MAWIEETLEAGPAAAELVPESELKRFSYAIEFFEFRADGGLPPTSERLAAQAVLQRRLKQARVARHSRRLARQAPAEVECRRCGTLIPAGLELNGCCQDCFDREDM